MPAWPSLSRKQSRPQLRLAYLAQSSVPWHRERILLPSHASLFSQLMLLARAHVLLLPDQRQLKRERTRQ